MEQSIVDHNQELEYQNNNLTTPCRVQKRLFIISSSSSKRSLFRDVKESGKDNENISDAESDLGPMSPLALTDHSSCDSSPGRQFVSPLATPEKSPSISHSSWDRLLPGSTKNSFNGSMSPFSSLKKITRSARFSPTRIFSLSPKSKSSHSSRNSQAENTITNLDSADDTIMLDEIVPETPVKKSDFDDQLSYVSETPQKEEYIEQKLITPLGSVTKNIPIPRIHRRKSSSLLELNECISPEIKKCNLKRNLEDSLSFCSTKYQETDELSSAPRARAALFQENNKIRKEKEKGLTLNPKSFYGSTDKSRKSIEVEWRDSQIDHKKRRSLPSYNLAHKRAVKKHKKGEINCGVGHGIKRPKPKRHSLQNIVLKTEKQNDNVNNKTSEVKENLNPKIESLKNHCNEKLELKESDPNKKFFKSKSGHNAVITVNDNKKLKITHNPEDGEHINKKSKLNVSFDAADLTVDEPAIEATLKKNKVDNILKILENDWADDEYDDVDSTPTISSVINSWSPKKSQVMLKNLTMSPGSELSNMASSMNIEDISVPAKNVENIYSKNTDKIIEIPSQKFYPLFSKGYSPNIIEDQNPKKRKRTTAWQLSAKYNNAENQYQIDAGQKMFGATQCNECGIVYHTGDPDDENAHLNYHNSFRVLKFQGWKNERVVYNDSYTSSRIILIEAKDSNLYWKKVTEVLEIVDRDLGLSDMKLSFYRDKKVYMYVRDKTILGVLVAEHVKNAFRMIPELSELNCCTSETTPIKCGINVVWTAMSHRRQGIATKLVDTLRANYYYGYIMSIEDIAFSTPTPSGKQFAEKYTKTCNFKVY